MMLQRHLESMVALLVLVLTPLGALAGETLSGVIDSVTSADSRNRGVELMVRKAPEYGQGAISVEVSSVTDDKSRADVMRVILLTINELKKAQPKVALVVFLQDGKESLLIEGSKLAPIVENWRAGKPMPAWRLLIEEAVMADGSKIELPEALLPRTTAALSAVDRFLPSDIQKSSKPPKKTASRPDTSTDSDTERALSVVKVEVTNKRLDKSGYSDSIWWDATYTLADGEKPVRAVKGVLEFADLFGEVQCQVRITVNKTLKPGEPVTTRGVGIDFNQFMDSHRWMATTDLTDMKIHFRTKQIIFQNGDTEKL